MAVTTTDMYSGPVTKVEVGGVDMGGTYDGVEISREDDFSDIHCDQVFGPINRSLLSRKFIVALNGAELSLANLETLLAQESGNLSASSLKLDDDEQGSTTLEITHPTPDGGGVRTWKFDTVYNVGGGAITYKKDGTQAVIPTTFDCLPDADGEYGYVGDA